MSPGARTVPGAAILARVEDALTAVLTLTEGLAEAELLRSRLTRQEVVRHLQLAAAALAEADPSLREPWAELDFDVWADGARALAGGPGPACDASLWALVDVHVPATAGWVRIYRARSAPAPTPREVSP